MDKRAQRVELRMQLARLAINAGEVTKGIRHLKKPQNVSILIDAQSRPSLEVTSWESENFSLPISKAVAEVLIANGMSYGS